MRAPETQICLRKAANLPMAFASLSLTAQKSNFAIGAHHYLKERVLRTQAATLSAFNIVPGLRYYFSELQLMWHITDEEIFQNYLRRLGIEYDVIIKMVQRVKQNPMAINFDFIQKLLMEYKRLFELQYGSRLKSRDALLAVTFDTLFDAGATPLENGENVITISSGLFNFQRWFYCRQVFDELFPVFVPSKVRRTITLSVEQQAAVRQIINAMHALSRIMFQNPILGATATALRVQYLDHVEAGLQAHMAREGMASTRSDWKSAAAFMLCHELGHINLGHLDEVREWHRNSSVSEMERHARLVRRREMEHEADSYAVGHMAALVANALGRRYDTLGDIGSDINANRDYIFPVVDLFTIIEMGQAGSINFDASECSYPSNFERLRYLLSAKGAMAPTEVDLYLKPMRFLSEWSPDW